MICRFNSIAPMRRLFDVENFKRAFLSLVLSIEGDIVIELGYERDIDVNEYFTSLQ